MANIIATETNVVSTLDDYEMKVTKAINDGVVITMSHKFGNTQISIELDKVNATTLANNINAALPPTSSRVNR